MNGTRIVLATIGRLSDVVESYLLRKEPLGDKWLWVRAMLDRSAGGNWTY